MDFLNFNLLQFFLGKSPLEIAWILFSRGGFIPIVIIILKFWWDMRLLSLQGKYASTIEYVLLAIDIPKMSEQTPKAMEQVFATISGAHTPLSRRERFFDGKIQLSFSFEIISIDGFVQFLIRTPKIHRDLVEASVYAHYNDAEITEVEDYTKDIPNQYPNDKYNIWGSEVSLVADEAYPIRTYRSFEDLMSQEIKDPLSGVIETMSRIQTNEQVWFQIIVRPEENSVWVKRALRKAYKIAGKKAEPSKNWYDGILAWLYNLPNYFAWTQGGELEGKQQKPLEFGGIFNLTPGERTQLEAIEMKATKLGFVCKLRLIYISPHEQYQSARVVASVFGALKQFGDLTSNGFKPNKRTKTTLVWFFVKQRVNARRQRLIRNYKHRSWYSGSSYFILNTEELATIYHFPSIVTKSAMLKRTEVKKSEAPTNLPAQSESTTIEHEKNLRDQLLGLDLDNDHYERRYAKYRQFPSRPEQHTMNKEVKSLETRNPQPEAPTDSGTPTNLPIA